MEYTIIYKDDEKFQVAGNIQEKCKKFSYLGKNVVTNESTILNLENSKLIESGSNYNTYFMSSNSCISGCHENNNYYIYPSFTWFNATVAASNGNVYGLGVQPNNPGSLNDPVIYCSSNYTLLSAISICQQYKMIPKKKPSMNWYDLDTHYFLKSKNKKLFAEMYFATTETLGYAKQNWNFVKNLYDSNSNSYKENLSLNQGLGCGNLISSTTNVAKLLLHVLNKDICGISPTFIQNYITPLAKSNSLNYPYKDIIYDNSNTIFDPHGGTDQPGMYTTGIWEAQITNNSTFKYQGWNYAPDNIKTTLKTSDSYLNKKGNLYWAHVGESWGVSSYMVGGYDLSSKYIITACSTINIEGAVITQGICEQILKTLILYPSVDEINWLIKVITEENPVSSLTPPNNYGKYIHFSISFIVYNISKKRSLETNITYTSSGDMWNPPQINGDLSNTTFNYGSCGSKLSTALNTIIMVNDICNGMYTSDNSYTAGQLFNKLSNMNTYGLLNDNVKDNNLYNRDTGSHISGGKSKPKTTPSLGFKQMFKKTFYTDNIDSPAINTGWLTLKRLIYMNTPLTDFDGGNYIGSPIIKICPNDKTNLTLDNSTIFVPTPSHSLTPGPSLCNCNIFDNYYASNNTSYSTGLGYSYGPFQWLQMSNRCFITPKPSAF